MQLVLEVLEVPNENGNRDIINKGRVGALSFVMERPATSFFCLARQPKCVDGCYCPEVQSGDQRC